MQTEIKVSSISAFTIPVFTTILEGKTDELELAKRILDNVIQTDDEYSTLQTPANFFVDPLCEIITTLVREIMKSCGYASYKLEITSMWGNVQRKGNYIFKHTHANNVFSGSFYVNECDEFPALQFHRPPDDNLQLQVESDNEFSRGKLFFPPKKDLLVIFPSWLEHDVPVNTSEFDRLSLSFNIMCRGEYGMKNSRQEVIL